MWGSNSCCTSPVPWQTMVRGAVDLQTRIWNWTDQDWMKEVWCRYGSLVLVLKAGCGWEWWQVVVRDVICICARETEDPKGNIASLAWSKKSIGYSRIGVHICGCHAGDACRRAHTHSLPDLAFVRRSGKRIVSFCDKSVTVRMEKGLGDDACFALWLVRIPTSFYACLKVWEVSFLVGRMNIQKYICCYIYSWIKF